jgi:hypothetical protein
MSGYRLLVPVHPHALHIRNMQRTILDFLGLLQNWICPILPLEPVSGFGDPHNVSSHLGIEMGGDGNAPPPTVIPAASCQWSTPTISAAPAPARSPRRSRKPRVRERADGAKRAHELHQKLAGDSMARTSTVTEPLLFE